MHVAAIIAAGGRGLRLGAGRPKQFLDLGTRTLLDVLNADQELHSARFDEINTRFDLYKLNVECAYASGRLREVFGLTPPGVSDESANIKKVASAKPI